MPRITPLLKYNFPFQEPTCACPTIPVRFVDAKARSTPVFHAILDSGAGTIVLPKRLADKLELPLTLIPDPVQTANGPVNSYAATVPLFILGQGGKAREVHYRDEPIRVIENCAAILVGIEPVFLEYKVSIMAKDQKIFLEPLTA